ncbi:hypothetical protein AVEN_84075-1 [Araneus ventricosus]|uniref:DUF4817 domain-containing protein n=1 Tax=Araneus ventricosus TaxID=182803 RepID=A0A4Y2GIM5_ARAVE|nr:hypothetical protein AVEN_84075-1 [Araneus ventricosus]
MPFISMNAVSIPGSEELEVLSPSCIEIVQAKCSSVTSVQRAFLSKYGKAAPDHQSILRWFRQFRETGCLCKGKSTERQCVSEEILERVRQSFVLSPQKSTVRASRELGISQNTVWNISRRQLRFKPYCLQLLQHLTPVHYAHRFYFCTRMQQAMDDDDDLVGTLIFEPTFHLPGKVNRHNVRVWGTELPHVILEQERDSPKVNVFCAISKTKLYETFSS